jgi:hypothetical protein
MDSACLGSCGFRKVAVHLGYGKLQRGGHSDCCQYRSCRWSVLLLRDISLYSVVDHRLKCNTGEVFNCLIQFLLTMVLSIEERVFLVQHVFREGNRYTELVQEKFAGEFPETLVPHRNAVPRLIEKFRESGSVLDAEGSRGHLNLTMRSCWTFLALCYGVQQNQCATWHRLQQPIKRSEGNLNSWRNSEQWTLLFNAALEEDEITYSWFKKDGATAHTASMQLLNEIFGERAICTHLGPLAYRIFTPPEQQNLQCIVIACARLTL